tara:strand:- start:7787 stop:8422 length:636 start_codon:yes stop_codon:yes gene_type:complete
MSEITEIIEETTNYLEIFVSGSGQIEVIGDDSTTIEIIESSSLPPSSDLSITSQTDTLTINNTTTTTIVDITIDSPPQIEVTTSTPTIEIREKTLISGSVEFTYNNIVNKPLTFNSSTGFISTPKVTNPQYNLHVSGTFFTNEISSSKLNLNLNTNVDPFSDAFSVKIDGTDPSLRVLSNGLTVLKKLNIAPTPVVGAVMVSGSDYYLGFE